MIAPIKPGARVTLDIEYKPLAFRQQWQPLTAGIVGTVMIADNRSQRANVEFGAGIHGWFDYADLTPAVAQGGLFDGDEELRFGPDVDVR